MLTPLLISNSHAAVVARGWGKPCVVGAGEVNINNARKEFTVSGHRVKQGDWITVDGTSGQIIKGAELLFKNVQPTEAQIRSHMNGHLCRCGTYPRILAAIQRASKAMARR